MSTTASGTPSSRTGGRTGVNGAARPGHGLRSVASAARAQGCGQTASGRMRRTQLSGTRAAAPPTAARFAAVTSLHTLGPAGTNCELAARAWFARQGRPAAVVLHASLEEAAAAAATTAGAALIAPAAYPELHTLMYAHLGTLDVADTLIADTYNMVLARRPGTPEQPATVASHPAPVQLAPAGCTVRLAASTAQAAAACAAGEADACITTLPAMEANGLELVRDFGPVAMAFTVHVRR